jgi:hypothetical protein
MDTRTTLVLQRRGRVSGGGSPATPRAGQRARPAASQCSPVAPAGKAEQPKNADQGDRSPTNAEKKLLAEFRQRMAARHPAPRVKVDHQPSKPVIARAEGEPKTSAVAQIAAFGTTSIDFFSRTFQELLEASCRGTQSQPFEELDVNGALAAMHGIAPRDEVEGMLAAQMVAVHSAAMRSLRMLTGSEAVTQQDSNGNLAVKLLRTYAMQMEALQRYRGKGQQKMTVEHVHVYQGGKAVVGAVHQGGDAGNRSQCRGGRQRALPRLQPTSPTLAAL